MLSRRAIRILWDLPTARTLQQSPRSSPVSLPHLRRDAYGVKAEFPCGVPFPWGEGYPRARADTPRLLAKHTLVGKRGGTGM
jgi:hypothetical protein